MPTLLRLPRRLDHGRLGLDVRFADDRNLRYLTDPGHRIAITFLAATLGERIAGGYELATPTDTCPPPSGTTAAARVSVGSNPSTRDKEPP
jgi:hypothetical protein